MLRVPELYFGTRSKLMRQVIMQFNLYMQLLAKNFGGCYLKVFKKLLIEIFIIKDKVKLLK